MTTTNIVETMTNRGFSDYVLSENCIEFTGTGSYWDDKDFLRGIATRLNGELYATTDGTFYAITMWSKSLVIAVEFYYNTEDFDEQIEEDL